MRDGAQQRRLERVALLQRLHVRALGEEALALDRQRDERCRRFERAQRGARAARGEDADDVAADVQRKVDVAAAIAGSSTVRFVRARCRRSGLRSPLAAVRSTKSMRWSYGPLPKRTSPPPRAPTFASARVAASPSAPTRFVAVKRSMLSA